MKRKSLRKWMGVLLSLALLAGLMPTVAMAANMPFSDVESSAWYYSDVADAYDTGLVVGTSATTFEPAKNLTYAEAVTLAARMYQTQYEGKATLQPSATGAWYQTFVDYARSKGIITHSHYAWDENATRAGYMEIFAGALKAEDLPAINTVVNGAIPDVPMTHPQASAIYMLYRAGILRGNDDAFSCLPDNNITRAEMSAILNRMMNPSKRISFQATGNVDTSKLQVVNQTTRVSVAEGDSAKFEVQVVGGTAPYTYEWRKYRDADADNDIKMEYLVVTNPGSYPYTGYDTATLTLKKADYKMGQGDRFGCTITDAAGNTVKSAEIPLQITSNDPELKITSFKADSTTLKQSPVTNKVSIKVEGGDLDYGIFYAWEYSTDGENYKFYDDNDTESGTFHKKTSTMYYTTTEQKSVWVRCWVMCKDQKAYSEAIKLNAPSDRTLTAAIEGVTPKNGTIYGKNVKYIDLLDQESITLKFNYTLYGEGAANAQYTAVIASDTDGFTTWKLPGRRSATIRTWPTSGTYELPIVGQTGTPATAWRLRAEFPDGEMVYSDEILYIISPIAVRQWTADEMSMVNIAGGVGPYTIQWHAYASDNEIIERVAVAETNIADAYKGHVHVLTGENISNKRSYNWAGIRQSHHEKVSDRLGNSKYVCTIVDAMGNKRVSYESQYGDESSKDWYYCKFWEESWESWYNYDIHDDADGSVYIDTSTTWGEVSSDGTIDPNTEEKWQDVKDSYQSIYDTNRNIINGIALLFGI